MVGSTQEQAVQAFVPPRPSTWQETGLGFALLQELVIKTISSFGMASPSDIAKTLHLSYYGIIEPIIRQLSDQGLCFTSAIATGQYAWTLSERGSVWAADIRARSQYVGSAPVTLDDYERAVKAQTLRSHITPEAVAQVLKPYVLDAQVVDVFGPAIRSGTSVFLYGPPGNGKTSVARAAASVLGGAVYIPRSLVVGNHVITFFDSSYHQPHADYQDDGDGSYAPNCDTRWILIHRPFVMAGGELRLEDLDLTYDHGTGRYEAPLQVKANCGALLIDDFGRQRVPPRELLNRWIVPLERRVDFLTLHTGQRVEVPFEVLILFSTNLDPSDLVDQAFLRRIRYKVRVGPPNEQGYREILRRECERRGIKYEDLAATYLLEEYYRKAKRELRACEPRDLLDQICELAGFRGIRPSLVDKQMLDAACKTYFATLS